jgi:outer membrane protein assembly factor BamB
MTGFLILVLASISAVSVDIAEPEDGETYDGDWLSLRAIVQNDNEIPDSVHYSLNGGQVTLVPRLSTDWPTYMQNYANNGYSNTPGPASGTVLWSAPVCGIEHEFCSPVIVDGVVYFASDELSTVYALDALTGVEIWSYDVVTAVDDAVTYDNGRIYVSADSAWCLDAATGTRIWSFKDQPNREMSGSPVVTQDEVYFVSTDFDSLTIHALDTSTGSENWRISTPGHFENCMAFQDGILYYGIYTKYTSGGSALHTLFAVDPSLEQIIWSNDTVQYGYWDTSPCICGDVMYIGGDDGCLHAFQLSDGSLIWEAKLHQYGHMIGVEPTPALNNGALFAGLSFYDLYPYGSVCSIDAENGDTLWMIQDQMELHGSFGLSHSLAYFGEHRGDTLYAMDQSTGDVQWKFSMTGGTHQGFQSSPSITDGIMYIAATDGNLYAFGTGFKYTYSEPYFYADIGSNELIVTSFSEGSAAAADTINFTVTGAGLEPQPSSITGLSVFPNPFSSSCAISFQLQSAGMTSVMIFDLSGRMVAVLEDSRLSAGSHSLHWDGCDGRGGKVEPGIYRCRIRHNDCVETSGICLLP